VSILSQHACLASCISRFPSDFSNPAKSENFSDLAGFEKPRAKTRQPLSQAGGLRHFRRFASILGTSGFSRSCQNRSIPAYKEEGVSKNVLTLIRDLFSGSFAVAFHKASNCGTKLPCTGEKAIGGGATKGRSSCLAIFTHDKRCKKDHACPHRSKSHLPLAPLHHLHIPPAPATLLPLRTHKDDALLAARG